MSIQLMKWRQAKAIQRNEEMWLINGNINIGWRSWYQLAKRISGGNGNEMTHKASYLNISGMRSAIWRLQ